ncbi:hypothetical protein BP6252_02474 [Coleophoma cylindrospora]|uniref:AAA+ ATPase domain-containing protein n=1 Tax=Coleophoma cylindrospora TaxID=1849047 RepID=A0A3D8SFI7_9HELO|nr:hypothetical protein BP6252_02474 [Coleophoma cylindrospora]
MPPEAPKGHQQSQLEKEREKSFLGKNMTANQKTPLEALSSGVASDDSALDGLQAPPTFGGKILYRYIVRNGDGEVIEKIEDDKPIQMRRIELAPATKQTVLEVVTTKSPNPGYGIMEGRAPTLTETCLKIHSPFLINAMRELIAYYPDLSLNKEPVEIRSPYGPLFHYMEAFQGYKTKQPSSHSQETIDTTNEHIDMLLKLLSTELGGEIQVELERHKRNPPVCTWENLWLLYPYGEIVWLQEPNKEPRPAITADICASGTVTIANIHFNAAMSLCPRSDTIEVQKFEGEREISTLNICPRSFSNIPAELEKKYIDRGKIYGELCKPSYKEYFGSARTAGGEELHVAGKVMIDQQSWNSRGDIWREEFPYYKIDAVGIGCECAACLSIVKPRRVIPMLDWLNNPFNPIFRQQVTDDFYLICSAEIGGYALQERKWVSLHLDRVSEPAIDPSPFENLVLEDETKETIEALVSNYIQTDAKAQSWSTDFIKSKGEGRIFLLHGSPGVGKTCTAECVADLIRRPLLSLTCGDMGITADEVEATFKDFIDLGEKWGAVVLMDEADIYLEQRTSESLQRNSLVSVFLRTLEYFRGILFLTTNRIGVFDEAFISRIHVALHYKKLNNDYRKKIWQKNFTRLEKEGTVTVAMATVIYAVTDSDVMAVEWNGREIRNAFQTAVALAQYEARKHNKDKVVLEVEHLKRVVKMSQKFKGYLASTHKNQDEHKRARVDERRNDDFV